MKFVVRSLLMLPGLYGLLNADEYIGQRVAIDGWFRRGLKPYLEMSRMTTADGRTARAWSRWVQYLLALIAVAVGYFLPSSLG